MRVPYFASKLADQFSFLIASRVKNGVPENLTSLLSTYWTLMAKHAVPQEEAALIAASSLLMDAFPPLMHRELTQSPPANVKLTQRPRIQTARGFS